MKSACFEAGGLSERSALMTFLMLVFREIEEENWFAMEVQLSGRVILVVRFLMVLAAVSSRSAQPSKDPAAFKAHSSSLPNSPEGTWRTSKRYRLTTHLSSIPEYARTLGRHMYWFVPCAGAWIWPCKHRATRTPCWFWLTTGRRRREILQDISSTTRAHLHFVFATPRGQ